MSLSINNNITALNAWRNLKNTNDASSKSMEKLSSGLRINRAADDPAGLVISEKMRAQLNGIDTATQNSEKAINMVQTAEAALDKVGKLLVKVRQLTVDSANAGVNDSSMLTANQAEMDEAIASITRIANYTQFGTKKLLDGSLDATVTNKAGGLGASATFNLDTATTSGADTKNVILNLTTKATQGSTAIAIATGVGAAENLTIDGVTLSIASTDTAAQIMAKITGDAYLSTKYTAAVSGTAHVVLTNVGWGTTQGAASVTPGGANVTSSIATVGVNVVADLKIASVAVSTMNTGTGLTLQDAKGNAIILNSADMTAATLGLSTVGTVKDNSALFQIGAMETQTVSVTIRSTKAVDLGKFATYGDNNANVTAFASLNDLSSSGALAGVLKNGSTDQKAQAMGLIDKAIDDVTGVRGALGAVQADNLQVQLDSLRVAYENLQASESTIRDADMTREMSEFTKNSIMMQAGTAMLAQANQQPNQLLSLLK